MRLKNRTALVTAAGQGIGRASALALAAEGAQVWATDLNPRLLDGFENTAENYRGELPAIFEEAGLQGAEQTDRLRTPFGTLALYRARRPGG